MGNAGRVAVYDLSTYEWWEWRLPDDAPRAYAIYVDQEDKVGLSDFATNTLKRFDPLAEFSETFVQPTEQGQVRWLLSRPGEVWGYRCDKLVVVRTVE